MFIRLWDSIRKNLLSYVYVLGLSLMAAALLYPLFITTSYKFHERSGGNPNAAYSLPLTYMHRLLDFSAYSAIQAILALAGPSLSLLAVGISLRKREPREDPQLFAMPGGKPPPTMTPLLPGTEAPEAIPPDPTRTGHRFPLQVRDEFLIQRRQSAEAREHRQDGLDP